MYYISNEKEKLQLGEMKQLLMQTYWANDRSEEKIKLSIENSLCFGAYLTDSDQQIGLARVITDFVAAYYICDVIVDKGHRGQGIGKALIGAIVKDERLKNLRGLLVTSDAHGLYRQFGFAEATSRYMGKEPN